MHGTFEHRVTVNLRAADHRRLQDAAATAGMRLAPFVRQAALCSLDRTFLVPPRLDELLARLVQETRRVGTNLNQVAARVNAARVADVSDLVTAAERVAELEQVTRVLKVVLHNLKPLP